MMTMMMMENFGAREDLKRTVKQMHKTLEFPVIIVYFIIILPITTKYSVLELLRT